jgi:hypothetical protein
MIKWQAVCKSELKTAKKNFSELFARNIEMQLYSLSTQIPELANARITTSIKGEGLVELEITPIGAGFSQKNNKPRMAAPYEPAVEEDRNIEKLKEKLAPFVKDCIRNSLKSGGLL